jgi:hypothetical protein
MGGNQSMNISYRIAEGMTGDYRKTIEQVAEGINVDPGKIVEVFVICGVLIPDDYDDYVKARHRVGGGGDTG